EFGSINSRQRVSYRYGTDGIRFIATEEVDNVLDPVTENWTVAQVTEYLVDAQNHTGYQQVLQETVTDGSGNLVRKVVYTIGHDHISQTTFGPSDPVEGMTLVFHMDGHGSTRILTDLAGTIANLATPQIFHYTAYGQAINFTMSEAATQYLYSGEQFDSRVGQQYLRARYYNQATGVFNRLDPFFGNSTDPQSFHKYLYTHGDPVNGIDPTGMMNLASIAVSSGIIGGSFGAVSGAIRGAQFGAMASLRQGLLGLGTGILTGLALPYLLYGAAYTVSAYGVSWAAFQTGTALTAAGQVLAVAEILPTVTYSLSVLLGAGAAANSLQEFFASSNNYDRAAAGVDLLGMLWGMKAVLKPIRSNRLTPGKEITLNEYNDWLASRPQSELDAAFLGHRVRAVAEFKAPSGRKYLGTNGEVDIALLPPEIQAALNSVSPEKRAQWHGWCAEIAALTKAAQAGERIPGGKIRVLKHRVENGVKVAEHGKPYLPCRSCRPTLKSLGVKYGTSE
ncbi:MAG: YwqJ-related putative deaminase, partial [Planctomycetaceae bacterium]|nr:YwqJ-related putative deaminase [Planctomycetaceae bacterium]